MPGQQRLGRRIAALDAALHAANRQRAHACPRRAVLIAQLLEPAAGRQLIHQERDPLSAPLRQIGHAVRRARSVVRENAVHVGQVHLAVEHEHRRLGQAAGDRIAHGLRLEDGAHEHRRLHLARLQHADARRALLVAAAGVEYQRAIAQPGQLLRDIVRALDVMLIADIRHQHAHQSAGLRHQPARRLIGHIPVLGQQRANPLARLAVHAGLVVDDARYRARRYACLPGNVINGHVVLLLCFLYTLLIPFCAAIVNPLPCPYRKGRRLSSPSLIDSLTRPCPHSR